MATAQPLNPEVLALSASPMSLLEYAVRNGSAIDVIERLAALHREERNYQAEVAFDEALNRCQEKLRQVSADASNPQTNSRYASYAKLDRAVRPVYTAEGFSISFGEANCPTPGKTRFLAFLSRAGVTKEYFKDMSPSTKGPKGNDVMTPIHADASADSYAKRYHLKNIFNIAIGEDDGDGNQPVSDRVTELCGELSRASTMEQLRKIFIYAYTEATEAKDKNAQAAYIRVKDQRKKDLGR